MTKNTETKSLVNKLISKKDSNTKGVVMDAYDIYKEAADIMEQTNYALGRKEIYTSSFCLSKDFEVNHNVNTKKSAGKKSARKHSNVTSIDCFY